MPFDIIEHIEKDETLATCQIFNAEVCYGSGMQYCATGASAHTQTAVEVFTLDNDLAAYFLGICQELAHSWFALLRGQALWLRRVSAYSQRRRQ